ncbi:MAG: hypothetical protein NT097_08220 [Actinobacteria bacterium]|nr:hypothetical protein [Actinomycetota bacterium]
MTFFELSKVKSAIANSDALCGETKIVTIDGPAGSGKTTLASELPVTPIVIIEGVGSGHTSLREQVSQAIWVEADDHILLDRVVERDGEVVRDEMLIWKARERAYFELHEVKNAAQIHLRGQ